MVDDTYPQDVNHGILLTHDESLLLVNGSVYGCLAVYSYPKLELKTTIPVGTDPNSIAQSLDGRYAYVSNRVSRDVSVIDLEQLEEVKRIKLGEKTQRMVVIDVPE